MFLQPNRISVQLEALGFHLWLASETDGEFRWSRPGSLPNLFEHVWITAYGENQNVIGSYSAASVIAGPEPCDGLYCERYNVTLCSERRVIREPNGRVVKDSFTRIVDANHALKWESQFREVAPSMARDLSREEGHRLVQDSEGARRAAMKYWRNIRTISKERDYDYLAQQLRNRMTIGMLSEADRLAEAAVGRNEFLAAYQAACCSMVLFAENVEGSAWFVGKRYSEDNALVWRVSILADILMRDRLAARGDTKWEIDFDAPHF